MRGYPADVPVERGRVGAMAVCAGSQTAIAFKPYVWGLSDPALMSAILYEQPEQVVEPVRARVFSDADRVLLMENAQREQKKAAKRRAKAERQAAERREEMRQRTIEYERLMAERTQAAEQAAEQAREVKAPRPMKRPTPSQGWQPPTGSDIADILVDLTAGERRRGVRGG